MLRDSNSPLCAGILGSGAKWAMISRVLAHPVSSE